MNYRCTGCKTIIPANDGFLLATLPDRIAEVYPVEPKYAFNHTRYHLSVDATDALESVMLTVASADFCMKKLYRCQGKAYTRVVKTYISKVEADGKDFPISFYDWVGRWPPSGKQLREYYNAGDRSLLTDYGYSNFERYNRELQSVGQNGFTGAVATDWTFTTLKTYFRLPNGKALFTMKLDTGETAMSACVPSTKARDISHLLIHMISRGPNFRPTVLYTYEWPTNSDFWQNIFGRGQLGRLGLFHLMQRIIKTFNKVSDNLFWKTMVRMKTCFYLYNDEDYSGVVGALRNGTLGKDGHQHSSDEIAQLKHSNRWNQRYTPYLRKVVHQAESMQQKLNELIADVNYEEDDEGRLIFSKVTEDSIYEQFENLQYAADPPGVSVYKKLPGSANSEHGLNKWA
jgi:hypothetical protein